VKNFIEKQPNWLIQLFVGSLITYLFEHLDAALKEVVKLLKHPSWHMLVLLFPIIFSFLIKHHSVLLLLVWAILEFGIWLDIILLKTAHKKWVRRYNAVESFVRYGIKIGLLHPIIINIL
jgi:hypothetical protein